MLSDEDYRKAQAALAVQVAEIQVMVAKAAKFAADNGLEFDFAFIETEVEDGWSSSSNC